MQQPNLQERLTAYRQWRTRIARSIKELDGWLVENRRATDQTRACIATTLATIHADRLNVAFLSTGGRGKSELINALFFHGYGRRLLPSYPGLADICPTELFWDSDQGEAYLRLLPIETLGAGIPFARLRAEPTHWVHHPLDIQDPEQTTNRLREATQTKIVARADAIRLGLAVDDPAADQGPVEIPRWRHSVISFPSPMLRQGLAIFDLPSLAVSEVTAELLAQAQIVVCVLAADEDVDARHLDLWRRQLRAATAGRQKGVVVALNRVERLWDQEDETVTAQQIAQRRFAAAAGLVIEAAQVFPVSAHKALVARVKEDKDLLRRAGVEALEAHILTRLLQIKRTDHISGLESGLGPILERNRARLGARIERARARLAELEAFRDKSSALIDQLLVKTREDQEVYMRAVQEFQTARDTLLNETKRCRDILDRDNIEALIIQTHTDMARSWTTAGIAGAMKGLFDELRRAMQAIATETERVRKLVRETHEGFQRDFGFDLAATKVFAPMKFRVEIELLYQEVEAFRRSPRLALAEQGAVIKRFHEEMVSRARVLFDQLRSAVDVWIRDSLEPLAGQIDTHRVVMERRLDNLQRLGHSKNETERHIAETQAQYVELARQLTTLRTIYNTLHQSPAPEAAADANPRVAAQRA